MLVKEWWAAVGMPCLFIKALAHDLSASILAASLVGPNTCKKRRSGLVAVVW